MITGVRDRFKQAMWFNPEVEVTIGGLGSIGSWLTIMMGRLVDTIYTYDFDLIEEHNLSGQLYGSKQIGKPKQKATEDINSSFNPNTKIIGRGTFKKGSGVTPITFACFDSMAARKLMFDSWMALGDQRNLYVDGRLTAEQFWAYAVVPGKEKEYLENYMFNDDEVDDLPCSFKSTTHISAMLASSMTVMFTNYLANNKITDIANFPFEVKYIAPLTRYEVSQ